MANLDPNALQAALDQALITHRGVGASACVYHDGQVAQAASGLTNIQSRVEMTTDTVMHIGSITKIFNTTLLMQLVEAGTIDLDDPVLQHVPDLVTADLDALRQTTVRMLVNHSSGIDGEFVAEQGHDQETIAQAIPRFADMGLIHAPGADCSYCNTATVIAGYLCQRLSNRSWYDLVKDQLIEPLGLAHAATLPEEALLHRASVGHFLDRATGQCARTTFAFLPMSFAPAGATLMMSASDLVTFARAHIDNRADSHGGRILSAESARLMREPSIRYKGADFADGFGLGWMLWGNAVGHGGGGPGTYSWLAVHPEKDFAIAVLTNVEHGRTIIEEVMAPYLGEVGVTCFDRPAETAEMQSEAERTDHHHGLGTYENCAISIRVVPDAEGFAVQSRPKVGIYDSTPAAWSRPSPVRFVSGDTFVASAVPASSITYRFVNYEDEQPRHLATAGRLFKRVD